MDSNKKSNTRARSRLHASPFALALLVLLCSAALRAQTVNLGGTAVLGNFLNPPTVNDVTPQTCNYDLIRIDLSTGKVWARPYKNTSNGNCNTTLVDITNVVDTTTLQKPFSIAPTGAINDGVLEVGTFTLQQSTLTGATMPTLTLQFVPNVNNTPVWLRATGNVSINAGTVVDLSGGDGGSLSGFLRGVGGLGGPGGYRGGDGGNGGLSPSKGQAGFGPGGGPGGSAGTTSCFAASGGAQFLTTGITVTSSSGPAVAIPAGNDILTMLRGGSGGGGQGGCTAGPGNGGGGGGGAILIASNNTITINGTLNAVGGVGAGYYVSANGSGGTIRLVAATIAGSGPIDVRANTYAGVGSASGIIRLEAFTISHTGNNLYGNVAVSSAPGQVILPSAPSAFIQFASITDSSSPSNTCTVGGVNTCFNQTGSSQAIPGRTGFISSPDVSMPNGSGPASTVTVAFTVGPNIVAFPATDPVTSLPRKVTLEVAPLDPAQGSKVSYQGDITCPSAGTGDCSATITGVTLPLGYSSLSAFLVVNINSSGALARLFPRMYQGEPIESVRLQTSGKDTEYVLISKSGREVPFKPGTGM